jgi:hypothetical protein
MWKINSAWSRRRLLSGLAVAPWLLSARSARAAAPVRALTKGPKFHWFGYYDKWQFDPTDRYVLGMQVDFEGRQPLANESIRLGMIDLQDGDRWIELGTTSAWNWQQGCMLQWLPGSMSEIIYNDRESDGYVSRILDTTTGQSRTLDGPVYGVSPDGKLAVAPDFRRLEERRPGYGYAGLADPNSAQGAPDNAGIWQVDLVTGAQSLLRSFADVVAIPHPTPFPNDAVHWVNHLLFAPDGKRFVFLHRWSSSAFSGWKTRMITMNADGTEPYVLNPADMTSHFIWRDPEHILAWAKGPTGQNKFHVFRDRTNEVSVIGDGVLTQDGHCTYLPRRRNEWVLNDTYPDAKRQQHVHLFHIPTGEVTTLGRFDSPSQYTGPWRVDTHPRFSRDGTKVVIDSPHAGGRQLYVIDVSEIVGAPEPLPQIPSDGGAGGVGGSSGVAGGMHNSGAGGSGGGSLGAQAGGGGTASSAGNASAPTAPNVSSPSASGNEGCACRVAFGSSATETVAVLGAAAAVSYARRRSVRKSTSDVDP